MSDPVVVFDHVWKKFRRGERHDSLRDLLTAIPRRLITRPTPGDLNGADEFWALKDVSFEVRRGQALGIIGPNGAGKSTALKLLTRILRPTRGACSLRGRVGALIEIAAGFHPDLTGRENIYLQGAIMGMKRTEIAKKLNDIIEFAGVEGFIDTPVKRYSSGMNARLGFSIAANLEPDALVIDEILGVGDMAFQQRCVDRMREFKRGGTAIVFVSHNLQAVAGLCDQVLLLKNSTELLGTPHDVIRTYVTSLTASDAGGPPSVVRMDSAVLADVVGHPTNSVQSGNHLRLSLTCTSSILLRDFTLGFVVYRSNDNLVVYDGNFTSEELGITELTPGGSVPFEFSLCAHLTRGHYHIACHVFHNPTQQFSGRLSPAAVFAVVEQRTWGGVADLDVRASCPTGLHGENALSVMRGMQ